MEYRIILYLYSCTCILFFYSSGQTPYITNIQQLRIYITFQEFASENIVHYTDTYIHIVKIYFDQTSQCNFLLFGRICRWENLGAMSLVFFVRQTTSIVVWQHRQVSVFKLVIQTLKQFYHYLYFITFSFLEILHK